jgi:hypothetical protein
VVNTHIHTMDVKNKCITCNYTDCRRKLLISKCQTVCMRSAIVRFLWYHNFPVKEMLFPTEMM